MKILALHLLSFLEYARIRGVDEHELMQEMPFTAEELLVEGATIEVRDYYQVIGRISQILEDEQLGLRIGKFLNLQALGLIYQISLQTTTVEEAIYYLRNFVHSTLPVVQLTTQLGEEKNTIDVEISNNRPALNRIILECLLVIIARELTMMSREAFPLKIYSPFFTADYPENFAPGEKYSLEFSDLNLKAKLKRYDQQQLDYLVPQYLKLIQSFKSEDNFQHQVKIALLNMAKPALPSLEETADSFHLTPRTFQRKLAREAITFRQLTDDLKREISMLLLQHKNYSLGDISFILGYAEPAAFIHSFKKWYGQAPSKMRYSV